MIDRLLDFLSGRATPDVARSQDDLRIAVAALLVEAAHMDDDFDAAERAIIERVLTSRFSLPPAEADALIQAAQEKLATTAQYYPFTREICDRLDAADRIQIVEMLWRVALADDTLDPHEDAMLRHVAGLIHVSHRDRMLARRRVLDERSIPHSSDPQDSGGSGGRGGGGH